MRSHTLSSRVHTLDMSHLLTCSAKRSLTSVWKRGQGAKHLTLWLQWSIAKSTPANKLQETDEKRDEKTGGRRAGERRDGGQGWKKKEGEEGAEMMALKRETK